jgi:hypothetical protein
MTSKCALCNFSNIKIRLLSNMEFLPVVACSTADIATGDIDDNSFELVSKFVDLLGSSSRHLSSIGKVGEDLKKCLSSTLEDKDIACILPTFHVVEDEAQIHEHDEKPPSVFWNEFERGACSMLQYQAETEVQPSIEQEHSLGIYTKNSVDSAPLNMLRKLQNALRFYIFSRLNEWKVLLQRHPNNEANELARLLTYNKMIKGCRGNTIMCIVGSMEKYQRNSFDILSDDEAEGTCSHSSMNIPPHSLACRLQVNFFVKLRHSPRTFGTSSFTLSFETTGFVRCE